MDIWRIERDGHGPYRGQTMNGGCVSGAVSERRPTPWRDPPLSNVAYDDAYRFGFANLDQVRAWFDSHEFACMHKQGYVLNRYSVPEGKYHLGTKQAIFVQRDATLVETQSVLPFSGEQAA